MTLKQEYSRLLARLPEGFRVKFQHIRDLSMPKVVALGVGDDPRGRGTIPALVTRDFLPNGGMTKAIIYTPTDQDSQYIGEALCSQSDRYVKAQGRVRSLARALRLMEGLNA